METNRQVGAPVAQLGSTCRLTPFVIRFCIPFTYVDRVQAYGFSRFVSDRVTRTS